MRRVRLWILSCIVPSLGLVQWGWSTDWATQLRGRSMAAATEQVQVEPIDGRDYIPAEKMQSMGEGVWLSPLKKTRFDYDELIYSWSVRLPEGEGFRLYVQCGFGRKETTPWVYGGYWGKVQLVQGRTEPVFEQGRLAMDQVFLNKKATRYQFKIVDEGDKPLSVLPSLHVIYTDNKPSEALWRRFREAGSEESIPARVLDLPLRPQLNSKGEYMGGRCQSAALAAAMDYLGKTIPLEDIVRYTNDPEYDYPGIWPRTIQAAIEFGFDAYIDRFRDWGRVRAALAENKVILCSILMPATGEYIDPPYPSMSGHIIALNGVTEDGRVVVTDSALAKNNRGHRVQWWREDFDKIWKGNGAVGMVICPPPGTPMRLVTDLPPFPGYKKNPPEEVY